MALHKPRPNDKIVVVNGSDLLRGHPIWFQEIIINLHTLSNTLSIMVGDLTSLSLCVFPSDLSLPRFEGCAKLNPAVIPLCQTTDPRIEALIRNDCKLMGWKTCGLSTNTLDSSRFLISEPTPCCYVNLHDFERHTGSCFHVHPVWS